MLNNAQQYAIDHHLGNVMSLSFGIPEGDLNGNNGNNGQQNQAHQGYLAAKAAGITVLASAGDSGANNGLSFLNALYPASDPLVTGVGGTNLFLADNGTYEGETVWNDSDPTLCPFGCTAGIFGATGGAPSLLYPGRTTADVGYNASVYTGVLTFISFPGTASGLLLHGRDERRRSTVGRHRRRHRSGIRSLARFCESGAVRCAGDRLPRRDRRSERVRWAGRAGRARVRHADRPGHAGRREAHRDARLAAGTSTTPEGPPRRPLSVSGSADGEGGSRDRCAVLCVHGVSAGADADCRFGRRA